MAVGMFFSATSQSIYIILTPRQLFIIDGVISLGVIVPQLILLPEVPSRLKPNFMFSVEV